MKDVAYRGYKLGSLFLKAEIIYIYLYLNSSDIIPFETLLPVIMGYMKVIMSLGKSHLGNTVWDNTGVPWGVPECKVSLDRDTLPLN